MRWEGDLELKVAQAIALWFGCGKSPLAPGTVGALGTLPLFWVLKRTHPLAYWGATVAVSAAGIWASQKTAEALGEDDPSSVVIDEVAGVLIALGFVSRRSVRAQALAWILFRAFDITKPGPIHDLQDLEPAGVGIMADDFAAGLLAGAVARFLSRTP
jgi:phosphatidylglycerophosphatase A